MATPVSLPDVTLLLDVPRRLRFDVNACAEIEDRSGKTLGALLVRLGSVSSARWLVWGMLLHETPSITPSDVGRLLQLHWFEKGRSLGELAEPMVEAIERAQLFKHRLDGSPPVPQVTEGNAPAETAAVPSVSATG
jgi:hypothetical protein